MSDAPADQLWRGMLSVERLVLEQIERLIEPVIFNGFRLRLFIQIWQCQVGNSFDVLLFSNLVRKAEAQAVAPNCVLSSRAVRSSIVTV
ncbi:MAG: hypothetical protein WC058_09530 [Phycisphaeraceae bacterium]